MNNSNALAEIQSKYPNCNLLLPAATSVQINPFYKCSVMEVVADTAPSSGDIFSVGKVKTGEDGKGKAIYEEVFSPAKPLLMKLCRKGIRSSKTSGWKLQDTHGNKAYLP